MRGGWDQYSDDDVQSGAMLAKRTIQTGSEDPVVLILSGFVLVMSEADVELGLLTAKRALKNNPNIGLVFTFGGTILLYAGDNNSEAIKNLELSLATSPKDLVIYAVHCNLGLAYLENGEPLKAEEHCQKSIENRPLLGHGDLRLNHCFGGERKVTGCSSNIEKALIIR